MKVISSQQPPIADLSAAEQSLVDAAATGQALEFDSPTSIRAKLVETLLKQSFPGWPVRHGINLSGAELTGEINLDDAEIDKALLLRNCNLTGQVSLFGTDLRWLSLRNCTFQEELLAERLQGRLLQIMGCQFHKPANFSRMELSGELRILDTSFTASLTATGLQSQSLVLHGVRIEGEINLSGSRIENEVDVADAHICAQGWNAANLDYPMADDAFHLTDARVGSLAIRDTSIDGCVHCDGLTSRGNVQVSDVEINASRVGFVGARIDGHLKLETISGEPPILLREAVIGGSLRLMGMNPMQVDLTSSQVSRSVTLEQIVTGELAARDLVVGVGLTVYGGKIERFDLTGARFGGDGRWSTWGSVDIGIDPVAPVSGCLLMDRTRFDGCCDLSLCVFEVNKETSAASPAANVRISAVDARFGRLIMPRACPAGVIDLSNAAADAFEDDAAGWPAKPSHRATAGSEFAGHDHCSVRLNGFVYRHLVNPTGRQTDSRTDSGPIWSRRLDWLNSQPSDDLVQHFKPQPWHQLARTLAAEGYEEDAKRISIERRVSYRFSNGPRWQEKSISRILHVLADYGHNPWKTVVWCTAFVFAFGLTFQIAATRCATSSCIDGRVFIPVQAGDISNLTPAQAEQMYPAFNPYLYSLDLFIPLINLGMEPYWHANSHYRVRLLESESGWWWVHAGLLLDIAAIIERILGALMIALAVSGFTGLLTRNE